MEKLPVTGSSGLIGSEVVDYFCREGWQVFGIDNNMRADFFGPGGEGKQVRDLLHVADLCELIAEQIRDFDPWDGWVGNVAGGSNNSASLRELTALCREITGRRIAIDAIPANRPNDLRIFVADCRRLFARTAWRPHRDVRTIVRDLAAWVETNAEHLIRL